MRTAASMRVGEKATHIWPHERPHRAFERLHCECWQNAGTTESILRIRTPSGIFTPSMGLQIAPDASALFSQKNIILLSLRLRSEYKWSISKRRKKVSTSCRNLSIDRSV
jgi:hypothetical protein